MPGEMTRNARILATVGVGLALFLAALDQTIVGTALPRIVADLNGLDTKLQLSTPLATGSTVSLLRVSALSPGQPFQRHLLAALAVIVVTRVSSGINAAADTAT